MNFFQRLVGDMTGALSTDERTRKKMENPNNYQKVIKLEELEPDFQKVLSEHNKKGKRKRTRW